MSTIGSMYFGLINSVHCQHPERCALLLNFIKVFAIAGREIAPNTGANATKFFTLATKS